MFLFHPLVRSGVDPVDREAEQEFAEQLERAADSVDAAAQPVQSSSPARGRTSIVVGYDGSPESQLALEAAYELCRATAASLKLVAVAQPPAVVYGKSGGYGWEALKETVEEQVRAQLDQARDAVPDDINVEPTLVSGEPAEALAEVAKAPGSILLLGSRAYGPLRRVLLGSVSRSLASAAPARNARGAKVEAEGGSRSDGVDPT